MANEVLVPDIGDYKDVEVIEVSVAPGETVEAEDTLITLETDKATMDIPAPAGGVVNQVAVKVGDKVSQGSLILTLEGASGGKAASEPEQPTSEASASEESRAVSLQSIVVPDIGTSDAVKVIEILVEPNDEIGEQESLITLESDKASMEIPSPLAGKVVSILVNIGDSVKEGVEIATLEVSGAVSSNAPVKPAAETEKPAQAEKSKPAQAAPTSMPATNGPVHAGPGVRRYASELGVNLSQVTGTGRKGRITKKDVTAFVKNAMQTQGGGAPQAGAGLGLSLAPLPEANFEKFGEVELQPLGRIKKLSGSFLHRNWVHVPHVTQFDEADITDMEAFRKAQKPIAEKKGIRLTPLVFLMKAVVYALKELPIFNSSLSADGESIYMKKYYHVGIAVDTPNGLVVPVVRDVDKKGLFDLAAELGVISVKARDGKLTAGDMQGGCFTISSLGGISGTAFTPIVNLPEVAILGVSKSQMKPVFKGNDFVPRLMLPLSLSYDHRVVDGADGARFTKCLVEQLSDIRRLLL